MLILYRTTARRGTRRVTIKKACAEDIQIKGPQRGEKGDNIQIKGPQRDEKGDNKESGCRCYTDHGPAEGGE